MDSSEDLLQNVYAYFLQAYRQGAPGAAQNELVAFENIGFSPGCSALTGNDVAAAALEEVSHFTDELPLVVGGVYMHTMRTISGTYGNMLDAAEPSSAAALVTFTDFKSQAQKAYQGGAIGSFDGPTPYLPAYPTPSDWYDLSNATNWQSYSYDASVKAPAPAAPAPAAPAAPNVRMQWRIVPQNMRSLVLNRPTPEAAPAPGNLGHPLFMSEAMISNQAAGIRAGEPTAQFTPMHAQMVSNQAFATKVAPSAAASAQVSPVRTNDMVRLTGFASVANIATQTSSQPVETPQFTMSFDYCLVRLRRPWLSGDLLATPGWYVPGAHSGDYASGPPANTGPFAAIPTAFIAVKNLVIDADDWLDSDVAARANAASFGPFSLLGSSTNDKNSVRNPGIQIIAWICSVQPPLPPDTDPSLIIPVASPSANMPTSSDSGASTQPTGGSSGPTAGSGAPGSTTATAPTSSNTGTGGSGATTQPASGSSGPTGSSGAAGDTGDTAGTVPTTSSSGTGTAGAAAQPTSGSSGSTGSSGAGNTAGTASTSSTGAGTAGAATQPASGSSGPTVGSGGAGNAAGTASTGSTGAGTAGAATQPASGSSGPTVGSGAGNTAATAPTSGGIGPGTPST